MKLSPEGRKYIEDTEGFSPKPYWDHKGYSIGYGHLMTEAEHQQYANREITREEADAFFGKDVQSSEDDVNRLVHPSVELTQDQFDSLVDFCYNLGPGDLQNVVHNLNGGKPFSYIADEIKKYDKVRNEDGELVESASLETRRDHEASAFEESSKTEEA